MSGQQAQAKKAREESSSRLALSNQSSTMVPQERPTLATVNLLPSAPILNVAAFTQPANDRRTMDEPNKDCGAKGPTYASSISASNNDTGASDETAIATVRHTDKKPPAEAHIETVTRKCDLNDYLINVRSSVAQPSTAKGGRQYYTPFEELVRCGEWERYVRKWCRLAACPMPRLRLCGGGEDSINNGTSAWGTPPSATSNGTANAWGVLPNQQQQQQQQQQQSLPPPVWGNSNQNNNNNNNGGNHTLSVGNSVAAASSPMATMDDANSNGVAKGPNSQPPAPASAASGAWNNVPPVNHHRNGQHHQPMHLPNANCVANNNAANAANAGAGGQQANSAAPKNQQLEQLNTMREALFAQDGWGCEHVNQDTNWEVPGSPEPQSGGGGSGSNAAVNAVPKPADGRLGPNGGGGGGGGLGGGSGGGGSAGGGAPNGAWKVTNMNTGTELWETNLRNGGQVPQHHAHHQQQQQPKVASAPWVPTNNLGGTWMEDDDSLTGAGAGPGAVAVAEAVGPVWNGSAAALVAGTGGPLVGGGGPPGTGSWGGGVANGGASNAGWLPGGGNGPLSGGGPPIMPQTMAGVKKDLSDWSAVGGASVGIGGSGGLVVSGSAAGWTNDGRTVAVPSTGGFNMAAPGAPAGIAQSAGPSATSLVDSAGLNRGGGGELRGDPRGISGRLNGGAMVGGMWGAGGEHTASLLGGANKIPSMSAGSAGQPWGGGGGGTATNGGAIVSQSKIPSGWGDEPGGGGRPSSLGDDQTIGATGGMLWGQSNPTTAGGGASILARQNSAGGWKDLASDSVMMGRGGPMGRGGQQPGNGGGGGGGGPMYATVRVGRGSGVSLALSKAPIGGNMWGQGAQQPRIGTWEPPDASPVWGDGDKGGSAPWNADLGPAGNAGGGGGWSKTPTTPKSGGSVGWPDPGSDLSAAGAMDWCGGSKSGVTPGLNKSPSNPLEYIRASKEFRVLCEMGHKKEEVEFALRTTNMNIEEAMELLRHGGVAAGGWRRPLLDDHHATGIGGGMAFDGPFSGPRIPPLNHAAGGLAYSQNNQVMLNNIAGGPGGLGGLEGAGGPGNVVALNNYKYLSQGSAGTITGAHPSFNHNSLLPPGGGDGGRSQQPQAAALQHHQQQQQQQQQLAAAAAAVAQPSNQQLRLLVQHIQLAVQNGFLNHQILNQPLAPQTLVLLNQLLNHIKQMQLTQSNLARSSATSGVSAVQLTLTINKHKSQIAQLQQQIAAQQSIYLKQQQQQPGHQGAMPPPSLLSSGPGGAPGMDFLRHQQDLMALQSNFGELALGKDALMTSSNTVGGVFPPVPVSLAPHASVATVPIGGAAAVAAAAAGGNGSNSGSSSTSQQSRLNQWKLPSLDKEPGTAGKDDLTDFSRAPGPTAKSTSTTTSTNLSSLGLVQDGPWTAGRTNLADGWPEQTGETDSKDWTTTNTSSQDNSTFTDLVPEFEPGKPWKGTQMKIEDDPSITPGSVARSPLSIATAKDSELFAVSDKVSPSSSSVADGGGGLNLTSSAWSFNAAGSSSPVSTGKLSVTGASKSVWPDTGTGTGGADVWCTPIGKTATRGPPPGLGGSASNTVSSSTGTVGGGSGWSGGTTVQRGAASTTGTGSNWGSTGGAAGGWGSGTSWLLLRNLTSQIDASTLRTLCMQHGPILSFHPYPAHGLALCRYTTRDEAAKAQQALNNCPLGASTISAECPSNDAEVQTYLQQLGVSGTATNVAVSNASSGVGSSISNLSSQSWRQGSSATSATSGTDTWGSGWPIGAGGAGSANGSANLWAPLDAADRGTPSSLNSFLPESLLGPELN